MQFRDRYDWRFGITCLFLLQDNSFRNSSWVSFFHVTPSHGISMSSILILRPHRWLIGQFKTTDGAVWYWMVLNNVWNVWRRYQCTVESNLILREAVTETLNSCYMRHIALGSNVWHHNESFVRVICWMTYNIKMNPKKTGTLVWIKLNRQVLVLYLYRFTPVGIWRHTYTHTCLSVIKTLQTFLCVCGKLHKRV
jgi:hypothetical protein